MILLTKQEAVEQGPGEENKNNKKNKKNLIIISLILTFIVVHCVVHCEHSL